MRLSENNIKMPLKEKVEWSEYVSWMKPEAICREYSKQSYSFMNIYEIS
jgi:hypothetical protein